MNPDSAFDGYCAFIVWQTSQYDEQRLLFICEAPTEEEVRRQIPIQLLKKYEVKMQKEGSVWPMVEMPWMVKGELQMHLCPIIIVERLMDQVWIWTGQKYELRSFSRD